MIGDDRQVVFDASGLQLLLDVLCDGRFDVRGPQVVNGSIAIRPLDHVDQLPVGIAARAGPGEYVLDRRPDRTRFGWSVGADGWKSVVHPPQQTALTMRTRASGDRAAAAEPVPPVEAPVVVSVPGRPALPLALFGVRPCEVAALGTLDGVLIDRPTAADPSYVARRSDAFVVAVDCGSPAATCFCAAMGSGPHLPPSNEHLVDVHLTELVDAAGEARYVLRGLSARGRELCAAALSPADGSAVAAQSADLDEVAEQERHATQAMARSVDVEAARAIASVPDAEEWQLVAQRCVACANCTAVCPTCFCTEVADVGDLAGTTVERLRTWDSCFSLEFSRLGDHPVRASVASRYRQWLTHKFATWHDQFGTVGCVGCGRCIAWCPVGIDITAELEALRPAATE